MELLTLNSNYLKNYDYPPNINFKDKHKQDTFFLLDRSDFKSKPEPESEESEFEKFFHSDDGLYVSEEEYWENYYEDPDFKYEWNNGILEEKEMPEVGDYKLKYWLETIIDEFLKNNPIGLFAVSEIGFKMTFENETTIRRPDFALILNSNPIHPESTDKSYIGIYDLCIEYLSDSKKRYVDNDTKKKKQEYSKAGVKEYYIIDNKKKHTAFYTLNDDNKTYRKIKAINGVIHSKALPGFKFRIKDLYSQPDLKKLINDDVYKSYVLLDYQEQCQNVATEKEARQQAEKEKELALQKVDAEKSAKEQVEKEKERVEKEKKRLEKEKELALKKADSEKIARELAEKEIHRLLQIINERAA